MSFTDFLNLLPPEIQNKNFCLESVKNYWIICEIYNKVLLVRIINCDRGMDARKWYGQIKLDKNTLPIGCTAKTGKWLINKEN